jgi:NADH-quinone oxidoreductase subunit J
MNDRLVPLSIACAVALASAIGLVCARRLVHCACLLLVHSLALAGAYLALAADFLAMGQVVVYSGAIVVLFLFVVLLLPEGGADRDPGRRRMLVAVCGGTAVLAAIVAGVVDVVTGPAAAPSTVDFTVKHVAHSLFGPQLVPFELTAILLLVAIVGGVALWQRQEGEPAAPAAPREERDR